LTAIEPSHLWVDDATRRPRARPLLIGSQWRQPVNSHRGAIWSVLD